MSAPRRFFHGEFSSDGMRAEHRKMYKASGEFRHPLAGEFYLSGATIQAYRAPANLDTAYYIAVPVALVPCPHCDGTGKIELATELQELKRRAKNLRDFTEANK